MAAKKKRKKRKTNTLKTWYDKVTGGKKIKLNDKGALSSVVQRQKQYDKIIKALEKNK